MTRNLPLLLAAAAVLSACGDSTGPGVVQVALSPTSASLVVGATEQFTATAKDANGNTVTGVTVSWATSDASVASVDATGLATGTGAGTAAITATVSGVAASSAVTVAAQQTCDDAQTVSLSVGGSAVYDVADCIVLPTGAAGDRYRVGVTWPTTAEVSTPKQVQLNVTGLGVSASPEATSAASTTASVSPIPGLSDDAFAKAMRIADATERYHLRLRGREAEMVARMGTRGLLPRARPRATLAPLAASPAKLTIDTVTASNCQTSAAAKTTAVLVHENADLAVYQDSAQHASATKSIDAALAQRLESYYTDYSKDMVEAYWGRPSDIDGNGKVILFVSPVAADSIAAFVWAGDFFATDGVDGCAASNEAEIVYFNADLILDMVSADPAYQALATVAHEMKHVVGLYDRLAATNRTNTSQFNPSWIEEGTAEISGEMSSRIAWADNGGPATNAPVDRAAFQSAGGITEENYGVAINLARAVWFLSSQPNGLVETPDGAATGSSVYGSGWLFHRWLGDAYGNPGGAALGDAGFFRSLTDSASAGGVTGITNEVGKGFATLLQEFYTTVMLHGTGAGSSAHPFLGYDFVSSTGIFSNPNPPGDFPWPVTLNGTETPTVSYRTATYSGSLGASGIRIHDFVSNGTGTGAQIRVTMSSPGTILVVRLR